MADIDPIFEAQKWIVATIRADDDIDVEVYDDPAPAEATYPFLVIRYLGGATLINNGATIVWDDLLFHVEAYSDLNDFVVLAPITAEVRGALHKQFGVTSDARVVSCIHEIPTKSREVADNVSLLRVGGQYRVKVQEL